MAEIKPEIVQEFLEAYSKYLSGAAVRSFRGGVTAALSAVADELRAEGFERGVRAAAGVVEKACAQRERSAGLLAVTYPESARQDQVAAGYLDITRGAVLALLPPAARTAQIGAFQAADGDEAALKRAVAWLNNGPHEPAAAAERKPFEGCWIGQTETGFRVTQGEPAAEPAAEGPARAKNAQPAAPVTPPAAEESDHFPDAGKMGALVAAVRWLLKIAPLGIAGDARKQADEHLAALARAEEDGRG